MKHHIFKVLMTTSALTSVLVVLLSLAAQQSLDSMSQQLLQVVESLDASNSSDMREAYSDFVDCEMYPLVKR